MPITLDGTTGIILSGAAGLSQTGDGELTLGNTLDVASGGTGANNLNGIVKGDGTNALTAGKVSLSTEISGTLNVASGGTGLTDVGTTGNVLTSSGTAWISQAPTINLQSQVASTLQVSNGGTGLTSVGTSGNMLVSNGTAFVSSNNAVSPNFTGTIYLDGSSRANVINVTANTIDCSVGNFFIKTVSGALSWTFSNAPPTSRSYIFALELTNGGAGTQTWPVTVVWNGGSAPTLQNSGVDILVFITDDGGTVWRGVRGWKQA